MQIRSLKKMKSLLSAIGLLIQDQKFQKLQDPNSMEKIFVHPKLMQLQKRQLMLPLPQISQNQIWQVNRRSHLPFKDGILNKKFHVFLKNSIRIMLPFIFVLFRQGMWPVQRKNDCRQALLHMPQLVKMITNFFRGGT